MGFQLLMLMEMLLLILVHDVSHDAEDVSSYWGNTKVNVEGMGMFCGKFIVKFTLIMSLFL